MVWTLRVISFAEMTCATSELIIKPCVAGMWRVTWRTRLQATASRASRLPMCQFERQRSEVKSITEDWEGVSVWGWHVICCYGNGEYELCPLWTSAETRGESETQGQPHKSIKPQNQFRYEEEWHSFKWRRKWIITHRLDKNEVFKLISNTLKILLWCPITHPQISL